MAAQQRRVLTASTSKLGKVDICEILREEKAWDGLLPETRQHLYSLLPPIEGSTNEPSINPMWTQYAPYIEERIRQWQTDLKDGKESVKWRKEAVEAGHERRMGKFADWSRLKREEWWGSQADPTDQTRTVDSEPAAGNDGA